MRTIILSLLSITMLLAGAACGAPTDSPEGASATGLRVALSTVAGSGAEYRLTRGTFTILGSDENGQPTVRLVTVDPDDGADTIDVPVGWGDYSVRLEDGWELSVSNGGPFTPIAATLNGDNPQQVSVYENQTTQVSFPFILGQTGISLGITVDENGYVPPVEVPEGYDGVIMPVGDGRFFVEFNNGGGACCYASVEEARLSYPQFDLYYGG
jgi:hypothetical protein